VIAAISWPDAVAIVGVSLSVAAVIVAMFWFLANTVPGNSQRPAKPPMWTQQTVERRDPKEES
jgi:hypothetical protein